MRFRNYKVFYIRQKKGNPAIIASVRIKFAGPVKNNKIIILAHCDIGCLQRN